MSAVDEIELATSVRRFGAAVYAEIKAETRGFIERAFGRQRTAGSVTRVKQQTLSKYGSTAPEHAGRFMPIDVLLDLTDESGDLSLLRFLANELDCLLVQLPKGEADELTDSTIRSSQDFADMLSEILQARSDQNITEAEGRAILKKIRTLMLDLAGMAEAVRAATARDEA